MQILRDLSLLQIQRRELPGFLETRSVCPSFAHLPPSRCCYALPPPPPPQKPPLLLPLTLPLLLRVWLVFDCFPSVPFFSSRKSEALSAAC